MCCGMQQYASAQPAALLTSYFYSPHHTHKHTVSPDTRKKPAAEIMAAVQHLQDWEAKRRLEQKIKSRMATAEREVSGQMMYLFEVACLCLVHGWCKAYAAGMEDSGDIGVWQCLSRHQPT